MPQADRRGAGRGAGNSWIIGDSGRFGRPAVGSNDAAGISADSITSRPRMMFGWERRGVSPPVKLQPAGLRRAAPKHWLLRRGEMGSSQEVEIRLTLDELLTPAR